MSNKPLGRFVESCPLKFTDGEKLPCSFCGSEGLKRFRKIFAHKMSARFLQHRPGGEKSFGGFRSFVSSFGQFGNFLEHSKDVQRGENVTTLQLQTALLVVNCFFQKIRAVEAKNLKKTFLKYSLSRFFRLQKRQKLKRLLFWKHSE